MSLDSLYREVVMDHHRNPRGRELLDEPDVRAEGVNPSCGDEVQLELKFADGRIAGAAVVTCGCAVSTASGSMLAELVEGLTVEDARRVAEIFKRAMHGDESPLLDPFAHADLGDLEALTGVRKFPVRIKCALLPWVTLLDAILAQEQGRSEARATTEGDGHTKGDGHAKGDGHGDL